MWVKIFKSKSQNFEINEVGICIKISKMQRIILYMLTDLIKNVFIFRPLILPKIEMVNHLNQVTEVGYDYRHLTVVH